MLCLACDVQTVQIVPIAKSEPVVKYNDKVEINALILMINTCTGNINVTLSRNAQTVQTGLDNWHYHLLCTFYILHLYHTCIVNFIWFKSLQYLLSTGQCLCQNSFN